MYRRTPSNSWREVSKLYNTRFRAYGVYCSSLVFGDDMLAIGSKTHDANDVSDSGSVDLYQWSNGSWIYQRSMSRLDANSGDQFGTAVALGGGQLMVGTEERNAQGGEIGSVYIYDLDNPKIMCISEYECACSESSEDPTCAEE